MSDKIIPIRAAKKAIHPFIALWLRKDLTFEEQGVMSSLRTWTNKDGTCWPTTPQLSQRMRKSEDFIEARLKSLKQKGALDWVSFRDQYGQKRRRFILLYQRQDAERQRSQGGS